MKQWLKTVGVIHGVLAAIVAVFYVGAYLENHFPALAAVFLVELAIGGMAWFFNVLDYQL